jgi:hypothetical protein
MSSGCTLEPTTTSLGFTLSGNPLLSYTPDASFGAPETGGTVELGNFYVDPALLGGEVGTFDLDILFTDPSVGDQTYTAKTAGLVIFGILGAEVTFNDPTTQLFSYPGGAFDVSLPDTPIFIKAGNTVALDAVITPVPEPASIAGLLSGLMLVGCIGLRARKGIRQLFAGKVLS